MSSRKKQFDILLSSFLSYGISPFLGIDAPSPIILILSFNTNVLFFNIVAFFLDAIILFFYTGILFSDLNLFLNVGILFSNIILFAYIILSARFFLFLNLSIFFCIL